MLEGTPFPKRSICLLVYMETRGAMRLIIPGVSRHAHFTIKDWRNGICLCPFCGPRAVERAASQRTHLLKVEAGERCMNTSNLDSHQIPLQKQGL